MAINVTTAGSKSSHQSNSAVRQASSTKFFEKFNKLPDSRFRTTSTGLRVAVIREGSGKPLSKGMTLTVHYSGWTTKGVNFDSSVEKGKPFSFQLGAGSVIKGWEEGMAGIKPGERRQLVIPASLAYGKRQVGKIPPGATLVFNVEALAVEAGRGNPNGKMSVLA